MASGAQQPAGPGRAGPATRIVVALGKPVQGPGARRVESPERVLRMWEMLSEAGDELRLETVPPEALARIHALVKAVAAELQGAVSPALARELSHLIDGCGAEPSASEVRIEYASLLGWLAGLVIGMSAQLQGSRRELLMAGHLRGPGDSGSRLKDSGAQSAVVRTVWAEGDA